MSAIPEGWKNSSLPSLLLLMKSGGTPDTSRSDYYGGDIPFVAIDDLTSSSKYLIQTSKKITKEGLDSSNTWIVPSDSILYSIYATLGVARINKIPVATNQAILAILNDPKKIDINYLYYWLSYIRSFIENFSSQTTQSNLSATVVKSFQVTYPQEITEQSKIAEVLSTVDQAIEQTEEMIAKQQRIKTGLMQDLLTKGIDEDGNLRSEETHEFKDSLLGRIPVEWEVNAFGSFVEGSAFGPRFPSTAYSETGNIAMLRTTDLDDVGNISYSTMPRAKLDMKSFEKHFLHLHDLLISRSGTIGITAVFEGFDVPVIPGAFLIRFRLNTNLADALYWRAYFNSDKGRHCLVSQAEGGVQKNLRGTSVNRILVALPSIAEQLRVSSFISNFADEQRTHEVALTKLRTLKTALMQDLLTGRVRVTPLLNNDHEYNPDDNQENTPEGVSA